MNELVEFVLPADPLLTLHIDRGFGPGQCYGSRRSLCRRPLSLLTAVQPRTVSSKIGCHKSVDTVKTLYIEELKSTWLAYWQREEEKRQTKKAILKATRSRQMQRYQQLSSAIIAGTTAPFSKIHRVSTQKKADVTQPFHPVTQLNREARDLSRPQNPSQYCSSGVVDSFSSCNCVSAKCVVDSVSGIRVQLERNRMSDLEWLYGMPSEDEIELEVRLEHGGGFACFEKVGY